MEKNLQELSNTLDPSSKRYHGCGYVYKKLSLGEREWICPGCGKLVH